MIPPVPPLPQTPQGPAAGGIAPSSPGRPDRSGSQARGKVLAGLGLEALRVAGNMFPLDSDEYIEVTSAVTKLAKLFRKPPEDLGMNELNFLKSQVYPGPQGPTPGGGQMPPQPPMPPGMMGGVAA